MGAAAGAVQTTLISASHVSNLGGGHGQNVLTVIPGEGYVFQPLVVHATPVGGRVEVLYRHGCAAGGAALPVPVGLEIGVSPVLATLLAEIPDIASITHIEEGIAGSAVVEVYFRGPRRPHQVAAGGAADLRISVGGRRWLRRRCRRLGGGSLVG